MATKKGGICGLFCHKIFSVVYMFYQGLALLESSLEKSPTLILDGPVDFLGNTAARLL